MARKNRDWQPGGIYHVMSRGNRKTAIFKEECDYQYFLELIGKVQAKYPFTVHSICLMTNHFHLVIETDNVELGIIMSKILSAYAVHFNYTYKCSGHLFGGRYKSSLIEDDIYFLEVSRYIHLNPVKARIVCDPSTYEYSSYALFIYDECDRRKSRITEAMADIVDISRVLSAFGDDSRAQYKMFVEGKLSRARAEQEMLIMKDMGEDEMWLP